MKTVIYFSYLLYSLKNSDSYGLIAEGQQAISDIRLKSITIYPVKSCQGFSVQSWPLTTGGMHLGSSAVQFFSSICSSDTVLRCHYICDPYIMLLFLPRFKIR